MLFMAFTLSTLCDSSVDQNSIKQLSVVITSTSVKEEQHQQHVNEYIKKSDTSSSVTRYNGWQHKQYYRNKERIFVENKCCLY